MVAIQYPSECLQAARCFLLLVHHRHHHHHLPLTTYNRSGLRHSHPAALPACVPAGLGKMWAEISLEVGETAHIAQT